MSGLTAPTLTLSPLSPSPCTSIHCHFFVFNVFSGGIKYPLTPEQYIVKLPDNSGKMTCQLGIAGGQGLPFWILYDSHEFCLSLMR